MKTSDLRRNIILSLFSTRRFQSHQIHYPTLLALSMWYSKFIFLVISRDINFKVSRNFKERVFFLLVITHEYVLLILIFSRRIVKKYYILIMNYQWRSYPWSQEENKQNMHFFTVPFYMFHVLYRTFYALNTKTFY